MNIIKNKEKIFLKVNEDHNSSTGNKLKYKHKLLNSGKLHIQKGEMTDVRK